MSATFREIIRLLIKVKPFTPAQAIIDKYVSRRSRGEYQTLLSTHEAPVKTSQDTAAREAIQRAVLKAIRASEIESLENEFTLDDNK